MTGQTADDSMPAPARPSGPDLDRLARDAATGDAAMVAKLLAVLNPLLVRYCRGWLGREQWSYRRADEVAREVGEAVLDVLPAYTDRHGSFLRLVHAIASKKLEGVRGPRDGASKPALTALLHALPPMDREIVVLRIAEGLSAVETAAVVGLSPAQVRVAQHRALGRLRDMLDR